MQTSTDGECVYFNISNPSKMLPLGTPCEDGNDQADARRYKDPWFPAKTLPLAASSMLPMWQYGMRQTVQRVPTISFALGLYSAKQSSINHCSLTERFSS